MNVRCDIRTKGLANDGAFSNHRMTLMILVTVASQTGTVGASHLSGYATIFDVPPGTANAFDAENIVQYIHYDLPLCFDEAKEVCTAIGGALAKIETVAKKTWIESMDTGGLDIISNNHMWTGLVDPAQNTYWLSDCSNVSSSLTIDGSWSSEYTCIILKSGTGLLMFDRKECIETHKFLCQLETAITQAATVVDPTYNCSLGPPDTCIPNAPTTTSSTTTTTTTSTSTTTTPTSTAPVTTTSTSTTSTTSTTTPTTTTSTSTTATPTTTPTTPTSTSTTTTTSTAPTTTTSTSTTATTSTTTPTTPTSSSMTLATSTTVPTSITPTATVQVCLQVTNISVQEAEKIAEEISKNLTIDAKATSSHRRSLTSAEDSRPSAKFIGYIGMLAILIPFVFIIITDSIKIVGDIFVYFNANTNKVYISNEDG